MLKERQGTGVVLLWTPAACRDQCQHQQSDSHCCATSVVPQESSISVSTQLVMMCFLPVKSHCKYRVHTFSSPLEPLNIQINAFFLDIYVQEMKTDNTFTVIQPQGAILQHEHSRIIVCILIFLKSNITDGKNVLTEFHGNVSLAGIHNSSNGAETARMYV